MMRLAARRGAALVWVVALGLAGSGALLATRMPSGIYPEIEFPRIVVVARGRRRAARADPGDARAARSRRRSRPCSASSASARARSAAPSRSRCCSRPAPTCGARSSSRSRAWARRAPRCPPGSTSSSSDSPRRRSRSSPSTSAAPSTPRRLRDLAELVVRPAISRVPGVGRVEVLGGDVREMEIILDPARDGRAAPHARRRSPRRSATPRCCRRSGASTTRTRSSPSWRRASRTTRAISARSRSRSAPTAAPSRCRRSPPSARAPRIACCASRAPTARRCC